VQLAARVIRIGHGMPLQNTLIAVRNYDIIRCQLDTQSTKST
jgi:hypothetical protein